MATPTTFRVYAAIALFLALVPAAPAAEQIDQSNLPEWDGGWTHVNPTADGQAAMWQTFTPACTNLTAVEIDILTANPGRGDDVLTVAISAAGVVLASAERSVDDGFDGLLRFEFPEAVPLVPEQLYELKVHDTGKGQFGWKYGPNTYERGSRYVLAQQQLGHDWFFRTYAWVESAATKYSGGRGVPDDPYQIATAADLIALGETPEDYDKHFILTADIDLDPNLPGGKVFDRAVIAADVNDATEGFQGTSFTGVFGGNGHSILGLTIVGSDYLGLFAQLASDGIVYNLELDEVEISGTGECVGALTGHNSGGNIVASSSSGSVRGRQKVGGLIGWNRGSVTNCYSASVVSGNSDIGGLAGSNIEGDLTQCYSVGLVCGTGEHVGGLVGTNYDYDGGGTFLPVPQGSVTGSFWDIQTSGQATSDEGTGKTTVEMQTASTFRDAGWDFVGETADGTCDYWEITEGNYPLLHYRGQAHPVMTEGRGTADQPYLIRDSRDLGIVWFEPFAHYHLAQAIDLSGITWSMAVVPWFGGSFNGNGYVLSNLHIQGGYHCGLFGQIARTASVSNLRLEAVDIHGTEYVGGLAGYNGGSVCTSYSNGVISGPSYHGVHGTSYFIGGLVGYSDGNIASSRSGGSVSGYEGIGGLVGHNAGSITKSYSTSSVSGRTDVGGLVGFMPNGTVTASFWDIETSDQTTSAGGTGRTTAEMQTAGTFLDAGWDFVGETANGTEDIWWIDEGQDYPRLWWELEETARLPVIELDAASFDAAIAEGVVLVDFYATWCGPCAQQAPILEEVADRLQGRAQVAKLDVDEARGIAQRYNVTAIPTLIVFQEGVEVTRFIGVTDAEDLIAAVLAAVGLPVPVIQEISSCAESQ